MENNDREDVNMPSPRDTTSLVVYNSTRERLRQMHKENESVDATINRLLDLIRDGAVRK